MGLSGRALARMCREKDIGFLIVLIPTFEQVYFDELNIRERRKYDMKRPNRKIVPKVQSEGIPVLDLLETNDFRVKKDLYLPLERIHLSVKGHQIVAENSYTFLRDNGFFDDFLGMAISAKKEFSRTEMNNAKNE